MKTLFLMTLTILALSANYAVAQELLITTEVKGCNEEIKQYCSQVTPAGDRMNACLYAHEDRLSGACQYALYQAAENLKRAIINFDYAANACMDDLEKHCVGVEMGEGRIVNCIKEHQTDVSKPCIDALKQTGFLK